MEKTLTELREERLQKLFADCQQQVLGQIIGPFGLSMAMFEDKNGGNVTTLHNFSRDDDAYVATESDKALHAHSKIEYDEDVRSLYEIDTKKKADTTGGKTWEKKRDEKIKQGVDEYTGAVVSSDGKITLKSGEVVNAELDHVVSIGETHRSAKNHLALGKVVTDPATGEQVVDTSRIREMVNHDDNLALTNKPANGSKKAHDLKEWAGKERADGTTNAEEFGLDDRLVDEAYSKARAHVESTANNALLKKQTTELLQTGAKQAALMGLRQSLGLLLTELVNGLFNEFKVLIKAGVEAGKTLFEEIKERLQRVIASVVKKIPAAASQAFQGGVSGFMSNLITFLINNFLSTAKRFVTIIREGLLGLVKAFKMIMFPPKGMTSSEALQEGLKVLTAVVVTSVGFLLQESVATFLKTLPFLIPVADAVSGVLIGIMTGLLSAFLAYQLDNLFERYRYAYDEKLLDAIATDAKLSDRFASDMVSHAEASLAAIAMYAESIKSYQRTGETFAAAGMASQATVFSLYHVVSSAEAQVEETKEMISYLDETEAMLDDFFNKR
ncbi:TPA: hypothetical protein VDV13_005901 [Pseudomonas aeruginosa]|jgi:hypothetical protein|uniref:hypothetical protein n=1 Tax=Pseudomonas TaxID=286 RepID=UPI0003B9F740|nr:MULTISPECIES: hypothetical protein [Pseudomonas]AXA02286.1 hypothetical protein CSC44_5453 [Pseudomonas aeruginosa]EIU7167794.1 hypothetical protein [Pseudomonas aeruginosa]EKN0218093.1 hypothetical protein [Pseudomonas aeruginosa]EKT8169857.1 hypothetical protein [Pseudomonas aeruginosa]EKU9997772.1 hypothetical protein [Pseudomonas aeruginosa]